MCETFKLPSKLFYSNVMKLVILSIVIIASVLDKSMLFYYVLSALLLIYYLAYKLREVSIEYDDYMDAKELMELSFGIDQSIERVNLHTDYYGWKVKNKYKLLLSEVIKNLFS